MKGVSGMDPGTTAVDQHQAPVSTDAAAKPVDVDVSQMSYLDVMMQDAVHHGGECTIYLANGIKLQGRVLAADAVSLLVQSKNQVPFGVNRCQVATFLPPGASNPADGVRRR